MSAPVIELPSSSTSSTGHVDGLGRRALVFDRTTGAILERLYLRPELAVFEQHLRHRVNHLSSLEDERFARPAAVERDPGTGDLTVLAEFITGSRLSELLETSAATAVVPGVDVALGYLLESLPALSVLHATNRVTHGLIDPSRTVLTPEGQVVFLDVTLGAAVERLSLSRRRLWTEFGVAASSTAAGPVRFDPAGDITQLALSALMLVLGRNLQAEEYPDGLPTLLMEVIEVAQIRGTAGFAGGLQRFLQRSLPLPGRRPYLTADEAVVDMRQLVRREIGVDVCRQALIDFVEHMDAAFPTAPATGHASSGGPVVPELDEFLDTVAAAHTRESSERASPGFDEAEDTELEVEISLDHLAPVARTESHRTETDDVYDPSPIDLADFSMIESGDESSLGSSRSHSSRDRGVEQSASTFEHDVTDLVRQSDEVDVSTMAADWAAVDTRASYEPFVEQVVESSVDTPARAEAEPAVIEAEPTVVGPEPTSEREPSFEIEPVPVSEPVPEPLPVAAQPVESILETVPEPEPVETSPPTQPEPEPEEESGSSRRKKRQQQKSAGARKDKLRSTTTGHRMPVPPPPEPVRPASPTGWLVAPQRTAAFDPSIPATRHAPIAPVGRPSQMPTVPSFTPTIVGPLPQPVYAPQTPNPVYSAPSASTAPVQPGPLTPTPIQPNLPAPTPVKVRANPPIGFTPPRKPTPIEPAPVISPHMERLGTLAPLTLGQSADDEPRAFPWKLAAVAAGVAFIAIVAGQAYLPGRSAVAGEPGAEIEAAPGPGAPSAPRDLAEASIPAGKGRLIVQTQPTGIRVLIDGKLAGETPLRVDTAPGRRVLSFMTVGGEVLRSVRVVAGKAATLDIPVFSGWVAVFAPIVLDVAENGRSIGTTEQNRLMLQPGRHQLTLSNRDLGYSSVHDIEIEPGGVKSLNVEPRGTASLNAAPWAEVWLDGRKLGDTPLASQVPLGLREFVFKHPQHGERRVSATIRANAPSPVSVDFTK